MRESLLTADIDVSRRKAPGKYGPKKEGQTGAGGGKAGGKAGNRSSTSDASSFTGVILRKITQSPGRMAFFVMALTLTGAICVNALFLQSDRHPAPFFAGKVTAQDKGARKEAAKKIVRETAGRTRTASIVDKAERIERRASAPAPVRQAAVSGGAGRASTISAVRNESPASRTSGTDSPPKAVAATRVERDPGPARDLIGSLIQGKRIIAPRPPADIPSQSGRTEKALARDKQRIAAMQKALVKLGYPLTVDGIDGPATQAALEKFQRNNRLPGTGRPGGRTLQVLASRARVSIP